MNDLRRQRTLLTIVGLSLASISAKAEVRVDPALPNYQPAPTLTGTISAAGDDDMETLMRGWVALFNQAHPKVEFHLDVDSSATAPKALAAGTAQISFVGRKMIPPELALVSKAWGHEPLPVIVSGGTYDDKEMTHAEVVWVNPANPIRGLTLAQLDAVYGTQRRRGAARPANTWGDLGLTGEWAGKPIHAFRYKSVGASEFFKETALKGGPWRENVKFFDNVRDVPPAVVKDRYSIGLAGLGFAKGSEARAVPIAVTMGETFVEPSRDNVASRKYPLSRVVYIYVNKPPGKPANPAIKEFLRAVLSKEGQTIALKEGYLPLSPEIAAGELAKLDSPYVNAADNKIYAQTLLNEVAAKNPDLFVVGFHGVLPGAKVSTVIASNLNRVGKKDDDDDVAAAKESKIICGPRLDDPTKFEVEMPMKDSSGRVIGALSFIYPFHEGAEVALFARSVALRDGLAKKIPSFPALLKPSLIP